MTMMFWRGERGFDFKERRATQRFKWMSKVCHWKKSPDHPSYQETRVDPATGEVWLELATYQANDSKISEAGITFGKLVKIHSEWISQTHRDNSPEYQNYLDEMASRNGTLKGYPKSRRKAISNGERFDVLNRDGFRCTYCGKAAEDGKEVRLEVDHIKPKSRGGTNDPSNLTTACFECNRGKKAKIIEGVVRNAS